MSIEFNVSKKTEYGVLCESCGTMAAISDDRKETLAGAELMGFRAIDIGEDGIVNICRECQDDDIKETIASLRAKPRRSRAPWLDVGRSSGSSETSHPLDPSSTCLDCKGTGLIDSQPDNPGFVPNRTFTPCRACSFTPP